ncbi:HD domain-containing protein [Salinicoccus halitifaciens]|nr:HD domain-containing protein [Salinicoccus halitifaciens]MCD2139013.1 HD domain-containing protein [Salinicoccus halitifaciens]
MEMNQEEIINSVVEHVRDFHAEDSTGHDFHHVMRVYRNAMRIQKQAGGDEFIIRVASLLHDTIDDKLNGSEHAVEDTRHYLRGFSIEEAVVERILYAMQAVSFKGGNNAFEVRSIEDAVVQDADRLDALGAIGIARTFIFGGAKNHEIHNPEAGAREGMTLKEYREENTMINHFHEKLLKLKDLMHTDAAKELAEARHKFMEDYLEQFHAEWQGER